jgi:His-Xaa-Ser system protein HxsD
MENEPHNERDECCDNRPGQMIHHEGIEAGGSAELPIRLTSEGVVALEIDRSVFSIDAVLRAAYKFTDRCHIFIQTHDTRPDRWLVVIRAKTEADRNDHVAGEFANELIDQRLRQRLEEQFSDVRTLIVAQAFSEGNLLDPTRDESDYQSDPRGIGRQRP